MHVAQMRLVSREPANAPHLLVFVLLRSGGSSARTSKPIRTTAALAGTHVVQVRVVSRGTAERAMEIGSFSPGPLVIFVLVLLVME